MAHNASDLVRALGQLHLSETSAISLSKTDDDYVLGIAAQTGDGGECTLAATSSNYSIRLFNLANMASKGSIEGHEGVITGVSFGHEEPHLLYSSSLDKTVRCWDTRMDLKKAVQTFEGYEKTNNLFTSFDVNCNDRLVCAGTEAAAHNDTYLIFWDRRKAEVMGYYSESHQDDVTQVSFHPTDPDRMATGSTDGLICLFDLTQSSEDDALLSTLNSQSSVAKIGWIGDNHTNIYCVTHTNTLHVWDAVEIWSSYQALSARFNINTYLKYLGTMKERWTDSADGTAAETFQNENVKFTLTPMVIRYLTIWSLGIFVFCEHLSPTALFVHNKLKRLCKQKEKCHNCNSRLYRVCCIDLICTHSSTILTQHDKSERTLPQANPISGNAKEWHR
ncbi:hypothetical protein ACJMK2_010710 [Sinanodonta woodiana]|uniref:WD repeat-containing protein 89 n=1 Tax=Sinanodonta woodiana TaxID=1069815 RepID=A0ABD3VG95_SINWO